MVQRVQRLINAVSSIPGIRDAAVNRHDLSELTVGDLSLQPFADLPLAVLRRSQGGLPDELLIEIEFTLERDVAGPLALEFLSWWVRDAARSGSMMQLRSVALPPLRQQFGETLAFRIDWFYADAEQNMERLLAAVDQRAESLELALKHNAVIERINGAAGRSTSGRID